MKSLTRIIATLTISLWLIPGLARAQSLDASIKALVTARYDATTDSQERSARISKFIAEFYEMRGFAPVWGDDQNQIDAMTAIGNADLDGLEPEDFGLTNLKELKNSGDLAAFDVALSENFVRFAYTLRFGKVNPTKVGEDIPLQGVVRVSPSTDFEIALDGNLIPDLIQAQRPKLPYYGVLKNALADYRDIAADGGWTEIEGGDTLRLEDAGARVEQLANRLREGGWLSGEPAQDDSGAALFDVRLEQAVIGFQNRHGLEPDGIVGKGTIAELNVSAQHRINQVRVNLERARWISDLPSGRLVLVNIAGFYATLLDDGNPTWRTRVVVGRDYAQTPIFTDEMAYLEFNPTWTVPRSITRKELAPKVLKDRSYLARNDYYLARDDGSEISTSSVNWAGITAKNFPYWIVQRPGDRNALGRVKFMFPNEHSVYMHDTPNRELFGRTARSFSHGCIRTENPMDFAELLLAGQGWDRTRIDQTVASGKRTRVTLDQKVPVAILYWTVDAVGDSLRFYPDIYDRDAPVLKALDAG